MAEWQGGSATKGSRNPYSQPIIAVVYFQVILWLERNGPAMARIFPSFADIRIGEPDANVEYYNAIKKHITPIFIQSFFAERGLPLDSFLDGEKFLVYGQKGTGKTAVLRFIEEQLKSSYRTHYLIFKKIFNEEADLHEFMNIPLIIDEDELKRHKHYLHAIKRIIIFILLRESYAHADADTTDAPAPIKVYLEKIRSSSIGDVISLGFDSIKSLLTAAGFNSDKIKESGAVIDAARLIKKNNDDLLNFLVKRSKRNVFAFRLFIDEIHFSYRSKEALEQDAMLVRDCLLAIHNLNDRFVDEGVNIRIYNSVRSEYLEHPIISTADVNHTIESVGHPLDWSTFPHDKKHPLFQMLFLRFKASVNDLEFGEFLRVYLKNIDIPELISRTWVKPRDFIRFFKCVRDMYPNKSQLERSELNAVWRRYATLSWNELRSAASAFLNPAAIDLLEQTFRVIIPNVIDKRLVLKYNDFKTRLIPVYQEAKKTISISIALSTLWI